MDQKPNLSGTPNNTAKTGGSYGAGSLTAGGSSVSASANSVPSAGNNPRMDLLHNAGANTTVEPAPTPSPIPQATTPSVSKPSPVPVPQPTPTPLPAPTMRKSKKGLIAVFFVLILLAAVGGGVWWWLNRAAEEPAQETTSAPVALTAVAPTKLTVMNDNNATIAVGSVTGGSKLKFAGTLETSATSGSATLEIEIQPLGTAFTGTSTHTGEPATAAGGDLTLSTVVDTLKEGSYHWQARSVVEGESSSWVVAGDGIKADFVVDSTAPAQPVLKTFDGKAAGANLTTANTKPTFSGTAEANSEITITIDQQKLTATANAAGEWQVTSTAEIAVGSYSPTLVAADAAGNVSSPITLALVISAPAAAQQTPPPAATPAPAPAADPAPTPEPRPTELAKTGDPTTSTTAAAALLLVISLTCVVLMRRYGWR